MFLKAERQAFFACKTEHNWINIKQVHQKFSLKTIRLLMGKRNKLQNQLFTWPNVSMTSLSRRYSFRKLGYHLFKTLSDHPFKSNQVVKTLLTLECHKNSSVSMTPQKCTYINPFFFWEHFKNLEFLNYK